MNTTKHFWMLILLAACGDAPVDASPQEGPPPPTNRIDVPKSVRDNLGIEFGTVERRRVAATVRLPGQFELLPAARREYRATLSGHVELRVAPLQSVAAGDVLCTLDSPDWRARQRELGDLLTLADLDAARIEAKKPLLAAHEKHEQSLKDAIAVLTARIDNLEATRRDVGGLASEIAAANVTLAQLRAAAAEAAEQHTETHTRLVELRAAVRAGHERFELAVAAAAAITGVPAKDLSERWREIGAIEIRAAAAGIADRIAVSAGGYVNSGDLMVTVTDPTQLRFRAHAPQSDLDELKSGSTARIAGPDRAQPPITGPLQLGVDIDVETRMARLFLRAAPAPEWARPGMAAYLEVEKAVGGDAELAIPRRAVQRDGLKRVIFRRDSKNPDQVIRVEAEFGVDDGEWIVVKSDLTDGDEVVVVGAYELVLASSDTATKGGHFHADGTWHADGEK